MPAPRPSPAAAAPCPRGNGERIHRSFDTASRRAVDRTRREQTDSRPPTPPATYAALDGRLTMSSRQTDVDSRRWRCNFGLALQSVFAVFLRQI